MAKSAKVEDDLNETTSILLKIIQRNLTTEQVDKFWAGMTMLHPAICIQQASSSPQHSCYQQLTLYARLVARWLVVSRLVSDSSTGQLHWIQTLLTDCTAAASFSPELSRLDSCSSQHDLAPVLQIGTLLVVARVQVYDSWLQGHCRYSSCIPNVSITAVAAGSYHPMGQP